MNDHHRQSLPYPDTDGIMRAPAFVNNVAAVRMSELADVSDYIYYSLMLEATYPDLASLFDKLAITEMRHFLILGRMLIRLGGDPAVRTRHCNPYFGKPEKLDTCSVLRILSTSLEREQAAKKNYTNLAVSMSCDRAAAALLERIADDEEHHARMLSRALDGYSAR